jgi:hypothetical protein
MKKALPMWPSSSQAISEINSSPDTTLTRQRAHAHFPPHWLAMGTPALAAALNTVVPGFTWMVTPEGKKVIVGIWEC